MKGIIIFLVFLSIIEANAQEKENWMLMNEGKKTELQDTTKRSLQFGQTKTGKVDVKVDPRVNALLKYAAEEDPDGGKIWGYRVQIYFDKSKENIDKEKAKFKTRYGHGTGCYVQYKAPNYRLKVGNFRTEIEAENFKQDLLGLFPTAFVVKEKIKLPKLKSEEESEINED